MNEGSTWVLPSFVLLRRLFYCVGNFSNSAFKCTLLPPFTFIFRSQSLKPDFLTVIVCSPSATCTSEGVLPTKLLSISISAPEGFDSICSLAEGEFAASFPVSAAAGVAG